MSTRKLIICRGIPGSGKSTWAKTWAHEDPEHRVRFNNDDIRNMLGDYWVPSREKLVTEAKSNMITFALISGYDVAVDNMNLNPKEIQWIENLCSVLKKDNNIDVEIEFKDFFIPVAECIRRDATRPNPIGEKTIKQIWNRYRNFIIHEDTMNMLAKQPSFSLSKENAILVDMDATLCFNTTKRPFWGEGAAEGMQFDVPNSGVCSIVKAMHDKGCKVVIVTGREGTPEIVQATKNWLVNNDIPFDDMYFRPIKDFGKGAPTKERIYKENIEPKYNVEFVLDDNYTCVQMYRNLGLTVLQPNEGKF